jgi:hypothetical protein
MPFVIASEVREAIHGGSENPAGLPVKWYYLGTGKWTKDLGRAQRYNDMDAAMQLVLLKDMLPNLKFSFMVVDQLPLAAEAAAMDPAELDRLRKLAREMKQSKDSGYEFKPVPPPHEARIYKIGERQCVCPLCVERLLALFPDVQ